MPVGNYQWRAEIGIYNCSRDIRPVCNIYNYNFCFNLSSHDLLRFFLSIYAKSNLFSLILIVINCACYLLTIFVSPLLLVLYSLFTNFPLLCNTTKLFYNGTNLNALLFDVFMYMNISLRFVLNVSLFIIANHKLYVKRFIKCGVRYSLFCIFVPLTELILLKCGDVETNPGPVNLANQFISVCHWNLNGIAAHDYIKLSLLQAYNAVHNLDIICISETFLDSDHSSDDQRLQIPGYELIRSDKPNNTKHGGVCIYYREHLPLTVRTDLSPLNECLVCEVKVNNKKCFLTCAYRSPSQSSVELDDFCCGIEATLTNISLESPLCSFLLGDFNAKCIKWWNRGNNNECGLKMDILSTLFGYSQLIGEPTNFEPNKSPSCIDLIFADQPNLVSVSGVHPSLFRMCHHQIVYARINFKIHVPPPYQREIWHYKSAEADLIRRSMHAFNWELAFESLCVNEQVDILNKTLLNISSNFIPRETKKCSYKDPPWLTKEIKSSLLRKNRFYRKYVSNGMTAEDQAVLNDLSNHCFELISTSKESHFKKLGDKLNDPLIGPKAYWSILNRLLDIKKIPTIPPLLVDGTFETNFLSKANIFNSFFANQCSIIDNGSVLPRMYHKTASRINEVVFSREDIAKIIFKLNPNKAHGWDNISIKMIQLCGDSILTPLFLIFETALRTGTYPDSWKKGMIVPVHKKENKNLVKNYRPILLLPICGKIFEKVLYNTLLRN